MVAFLLVATACSGEDSAGTTAVTSAVANETTTTAEPTTGTGEPSTTTVTPSTAAPAESPDGDRWTIEVLERYPHDTAAYTQGLLVRDDVVYESTGLYGESSIRTVGRTDGQVIAETQLADELFAEGLELVDDRLIQLTWQEQTALIWDAETLEQTGSYSYEGEGWGLCHDGRRFVMSDGTAELDFRSVSDFSVIETIEVTRDGVPVPLLNELECVGGLVYANVWQSSEIVAIDPETGEVEATIDAASLVAEVGLTGDTSAVLNGIAYDAMRDTFLLTGKLWPTLFEVRFVAAPPEQTADRSSVESRLENRTVEVGGVERVYVLFTPDIDPEGPDPALIVDLHGFTSNPDRHDMVSDLRALAAEEGFVVAQPFGLGRVPSWDPSADARSGADDVAFIRAVVDDVDAEIGIDPGRVFAMGFSNGGGMANRLACDAADMFAAVGTVAGAYVQWDDCTAERPVAIASFHGTRDVVVPYAGAGTVFVDIRGWAAQWAERNGCTAGPIRRDLFADVYADAWSDCTDGSDVVLFTVVDGLHSWPGSNDGGLFTSTSSIDATRVLWDFFQSHAR